MMNVLPRALACVMIAAAPLPTLAEESWDSEQALSSFLLGIDDAELQRLQALREAGVLTLEPVVLPYGDNLHGGNWALSHPVAAGDGDTLLVAFGRKPWHYAGADKTRRADAETCDHVLVRSTDGGATWSAQVPLTRFVAPGRERAGIGGMRILQRLSDGRYIYISTIGVLTSDDDGLTWTHRPDAFDRSQLPDDLGGCNFGPSLVEHPALGLVIAAHAWRKNHQFHEATFFFTSTDRGESWTCHRSPTTTPAMNIEPALARIGDRLALVARSHDPEAIDAATGTIRHSMGWTPPNALDLTTRFSNLRANDASRELAAPLRAQGYSDSKAKAFGYWAQDTVDLSLNPVTQRLEAVVTNRTGRSGPRAGDPSRQSLGLYSINPDDFFAGKPAWRFEGTLLERHFLDAPRFTDGMHPAAAVIDAGRDLQHIFIYVGYYTGPTGIYRITRTLDTDRLREAAAP